MFIGVLVCGVALMGVAYLAASFSPRQPSTVALDIGYSGLRISLVLFVITLVQELVSKEIDRRTVILSFSYPVPRTAYVIGRYFGVVSLTALAALLLALLLLLVALAAGWSYASDFGMLLGFPFWLAIFGLWLDACVVGAFVMCIASLSTVASLPLILGLVFAVAGKSLGAVSDYLQRGADGDEVLVTRFSGFVDVIFWVLPDLSRLDWRVWPMYGSALDPGSMILAVLMAIAYVSAMIALSVVILSRRELL
jgi:ABC-type transport system involved in multi-copper enzyme maturation permease subunit